MKSALHNSPYKPEAIEVTERSGKLTAIRTVKRTFIIVRILNMWRIDEDWWRTPVSRLYYSLELDTGNRMTVFRDIISGRWYKQNYGG